MGLIGQWMAYKGWTPMMLAKKANIRPSSVSHLLKDGVRHQESTIEKYAPVFGVSVTEFLAGPPRMTTEEAMRKYDRLNNLMRQEHAEERAAAVHGAVSPAQDRTTSHELIGQITSRLCTLDALRLAKVLGYIEAISREEEPRKTAGENVTQAS